MHRLLEQLHQYHRKTSEAIEQLKELNSELKVSKTDHLREHMLEFLTRMQGEEENHHHFNEEVIRKVLMTTEAPIHRRVDQIARDHAAFDRIEEQLRNYCEDKSFSAADIHSYVEDYINKYFDHMEAEETIFFPMADKWLEEDHWKRVEKKWKGPH